jgi:hypothetical protein
MHRNKTKADESTGAAFQDVSLVETVAYMATGEGKLEEFRRAIRAQFTKGDVVQAKVLGAGQDIWISFDACDQFAQNDAVREHVRSLVVPLAS